MKYKGYQAFVEFDDEADLFHGEVLGTKDVITFQGKSVEEIKKEFKKSVDVYLEFCKEKGKTPDKPYSGKFHMRIGQELHKKVSIAARQSNKSVNQFIIDELNKITL